MRLLPNPGLVKLGRGSTIVTSQLPVEQWHEAIANPTVADAILDRLVHNAHRLTLKGDSLRKAAASCQTASNRDPLQACNRDPFGAEACSRLAA